MDIVLLTFCELFNSLKKTVYMVHVDTFDDFITSKVLFINVNYRFNVIYKNTKMILKLTDNQEKIKMSIKIALQNYRIHLSFYCIKKL